MLLMHLFLSYSCLSCVCTYSGSVPCQLLKGKLFTVGSSHSWSIWSIVQKSWLTAQMLWWQHKGMHYTQQIHQFSTKGAIDMALCQLKNSGPTWSVLDFQAKSLPRQSQLLGCYQYLWYLPVLLLLQRTPPLVLPPLHIHCTTVPIPELWHARGPDTSERVIMLII